MSRLKELLAQQEALEKQIVEIRALETADAVSKVKAIIVEYKLTQEQVFGSGRNSGRGVAKVARTSKVAAKYQDPETGKQWSGRGLAPKWLQGKDKSKYLIA
jgi:DNA-binding protein H-NS